MHEPCDHVDEVSHRVGELRSGWTDVITPNLRAWAFSDDIWLRRVSVLPTQGDRLGVARLRPH